MEIYKKGSSNVLLWTGEKDNPTYLLQKRDYRRNIAFPGYISSFGGLHEDTDKSALDAALREVSEEVFSDNQNNLRLSSTKQTIESAINPEGVFLIPFNWSIQNDVGRANELRGYSHFVNFFYTMEVSKEMVNEVLNTYKTNPEWIEGSPIVIESSKIPEYENYGSIEKDFYFPGLLEQIKQTKKAHSGIIYASTLSEFEEILNTFHHSLPEKIKRLAEANQQLLHLK